MITQYIIITHGKLKEGSRGSYVGPKEGVREDFAIEGMWPLKSVNV